MKLHLSLIEKWFTMTDPNFKTEDYRNITPYWCSRLLLFNGKKQSQYFWTQNYFVRKFNPSSKLIQQGLELGEITFKEFSENVMTWGYPKAEDTTRIKRFKHNGIKVSLGKIEWGAEDSETLYFVIKHGERSEKRR
jgi:hypothetical protein